MIRATREQFVIRTFTRFVPAGAGIVKLSNDLGSAEMCQWCLEIATPSTRYFNAVDIMVVNVAETINIFRKVSP